MGAMGRQMATIRMLGRCKKCKTGHRVEGEFSRRTEQHAGVGLAAGKVFESTSYWLGETRVRGLQLNGPLSMWHEVQCGGCGGWVKLEPVVAKESKHHCGAKCVNATGPACECACKGENHGKHV